MDLHIDENRRKSFAQATGIYVRVKDGEAWITADIAQLDRASLFVWLRSRGGDNPWAEATVALLLGHQGDGQ